MSVLALDAGADRARFKVGVRSVWPFEEPPLSVQKAALERSSGRYRYGFFLQMGLGKSRLILAEAQLLYGAGAIRNLAVVLPNSLKGTWAAEAAKVGSSFHVVTWPERPPSGPERCLFLINYEAVIASGGAVLEQFLQHKTMLVLDESARVKNPKAKCTMALLKMSYRCRYVRLLSGLPAPQNILDYWAQLRMLGGTVSQFWTPFRARYCLLGGWDGKQIIGVNPEHEEELSRIIRSVSFRARKEDWTDLPPKLYTARSYELSPPQRRAYGEMLREFVLRLEKDVIPAPLAVTQMLKLSQISSGFVINEKNEAIDLVPSKDNPKLNGLAELLEEVEGKVIVFAVFRHTLDLAAVRWPDAPVIRGGMKPEGITAAVDRFNESDCRLILCQVQSSRYGLTLLGHPGMRCHTVAYLENSYSLDARMQSEDRAHRHGQTNPVLYVDFLGTRVEHAALAILAAKMDLSSVILDRDSALRKAMLEESR